MEDKELAMNTIDKCFEEGMKNPVSEDKFIEIFSMKYPELTEHIESQNCIDPNFKTNIVSEYSSSLFSKIPEKISDILNEFGNENNRTYLLFSTISFSSSLFPKITFHYDGHKRSLNIASLIVAKSGSGKSDINIVKGFFTGIDIKLRNEEKKGTKKTFIQPCNISGSELIARIKANDGAGLLFDTEITGFSSTNSKEWGDYDTIIRKGISNETISIYRKTDKTAIDIHFPKISVILTGTPSQLSTLFNDIFNGLYSRFMFFRLEGKDEWKTGLIDNEHKNNRKEQEFFLNKYEHYLNNTPVFEISDEAKQYFDNFMEKQLEKFGYDELLNSVVKRYGLYAWKIAHILKLLEKNYDDGETIYISVDEIKTALEIVSNSIQVAEFFSFNLKRNTLSNSDRIVQKLKTLGRDFTRAEAIELCSNICSTRTIDEVLKNSSQIKKVGQGKYRIL